MQYLKDYITKNPLTPSLIMVHAVIWTFVVVVLALTPVQKQWDTRITYPLYFKIRDIMNQAPHLDSRIKVVAFDDSTVSYLRRKDLTLTEWAELLHLIDQRKPQLIIIDKIFADPLEKQPRHERRQALSKMQKLKAPIVVGAYTTPQPVRFRQPIDIASRPELSWSRWSVDPWMRTSIGEKKDSKIYLYGPQEALLNIFTYLGHIQVLPDGYLRPFFRLGPSAVLPTLGFYARKDIKISKEAVFVGDKEIAGQIDEPMLVNALKIRDFYNQQGSKKPSQVISLQALLRKKMKSAGLRNIQPQDIVFVAPTLYTGSTDFIQTPAGLLPGALIHVSFINSLIKNKFLKVHRLEVVLGIVGVLIAGVFLYLIETTFMSVMMTLGFLLLALPLATFLFIYGGHVIPIGNFYLGFVGCWVSLNLAKIRRLQQRSIILKTTLDGLLDPERIKQAQKEGQKIRLEACEQVVTIMFIDVVGFSLVAENQVPRVVFANLKELIDEVISLVHRYGGVVNKTLGDGLLCFFGYDFLTGEKDPDHAARAVNCAIEIQKRNLKRNLKAHDRKDPVYPLRIGIHTASAYFGDLGHGDRVDFTAVGNGVNRAKRMEAACEVFSILMSAETKALVENIGLSSQGLRRRMVKVKHHMSLIEAYEYDPFYDFEDLRKRAEQAYRITVNLARLDQRLTISNPDYFIVKSRFGQGTLINCSAGGLNMAFDQPLAKGEEFEIQLDSTDGKLSKLLNKKKINRIMVQVRWQYRGDDGRQFHGLRYLSVDENDGLFIMETLRDLEYMVRSSQKQRLQTKAV